MTVSTRFRVEGVPAGLVDILVFHNIFGVEKNKKGSLLKVNCV